MGGITPVGNNVRDIWQAVSNGRRGIEKIRGFENEELPVHVAGQVKDFDPIAAGLSKSDVRHYDLFCQYAVVSACEAMAQSGLESGVNIEPHRLGVYIGSGIGGINTFITQTRNHLEQGTSGVSPLFIPMMIATMGGGNTAIRFNAQGPNLTVTAACATSTNAVGEAYLAIQAGRADAIITGGAEAAVNQLAISGFANCRALATGEDPATACLPFDKRRGGFVMGEGAGILVLEELEHAVKRGADLIAEVVGYGHTCDAYHYTAPRPDGSVTSRCIADALSQAGYREGEKLYINAHGTGTQMNDAAETKAIKLALGEDDAKKASISSSKSMTGHMLGAAGAVELIISALALRNGLIPPTIGLEEPDPACDLDYTPLKAVEKEVDIAISNSLGFGGHNATVAIRKYRQ